VSEKSPKHFAKIENNLLKLSIFGKFSDTITVSEMVKKKYFLHAYPYYQIQTNTVKTR
jgi:hypothetical protein